MNIFKYLLKKTTDRGTKMKRKFFYIFVLAITSFILVNAQSVMDYTRKTLEMCYSVIIPSLFPFFVCSGLLIYSGFAQTLSKICGFIMRPLFNVAPAGAAAFVLGIISGFPLGAICAKDLYKAGNLSKPEAERLLAFCNNSGPLFIIGTVGTAIYLSPLYGIMMYIIHIISSVIVGILFRFYGKNRHNSPPTNINTAELALPRVITTALESASKNILTVCFSIVFFSSLAQAVLDVFPLSDTVNAILSGICEFSTGILKISVLDEDLMKKLVMSAFIIGFSGLTVHLQVIAATANSGLSLKPYILGKCLHGIIAAVITYVVLIIADVRPIFSQNPYPLSQSFAVSASGLIIAMVTLVVFTGLICRCYKKKRQLMT